MASRNWVADAYHGALTSGSILLTRNADSSSLRFGPVVELDTRHTVEVAMRVSADPPFWILSGHWSVTSPEDRWWLPWRGFAIASGVAHLTRMTVQRSQGDRVRRSADVATPLAKPRRRIRYRRLECRMVPVALHGRARAVRGSSCGFCCNSCGAR